MQAKYVDYKKDMHMRRVQQIKDGWKIKDQFQGISNKVTILFLLNPVKWKINGNYVTSDSFTFLFKSDHIEDIHISTSYDSLFYMEKNKIAALKVIVKNNSIVNSIITIK